MGTAELATGAVTYAKMQDVSATDKLLGRSTAGSGDVEEIACTAVGRALIDDATASDQLTTLGVSTFAKTLLDDADASTVRATIGAGTSSLVIGTSGGTVCAGDDSRVTGAIQASALTSNGDLLTRASGIPARLGLGSALQVLRVNAGATALEYATPASITTGTYATMTGLTPAVGDSFLVTSGNRVNSYYVCLVAGLWSFVRAAPPVACEYYLDAERLPTRTGAWIIDWLDEVSGNPGATAATPGNVTSVTSAAGGLPAAAFSGSSSSMRGTWMGPSGASARWIAAVVSSITSNAAVYEHVVHYGAAAATQGYGLTVRVASSNQWGNHYWASGWSAGGTPPTTSTPVLALIQYSGTVDNLYVDGDAALTNTVTLNTGATYSMNIGAVLNGTAEPYIGRIHCILAGSGTLDSTQRSALRTWSQARWGSS